MTQQVHRILDEAYYCLAHVGRHAGEEASTVGAEAPASTDPEAMEELQVGCWREHELKRCGWRWALEVPGVGLSEESSCAALTPVSPPVVVLSCVKSVERSWG
eukprot:SAG11_NODE_225_length_12064_cov_7.850815_2_plen_103_part_00